MTDESTGLLRAPTYEHRRILGSYGGERRGPLVIVTAGIHGNEPAGVKAVHRVLSRLREDRPAAGGKFVALAGNLVALGRNQRFIDKDLNRIWTPENIEALGSRDASADTVEDGQQRELHHILHETMEGARRRVVFLDLHTSSAEGPPFLTIGDTLRNRDFALRFPLPVILGLEEQVDGALLEYLNNHGAVTMGVEGGHHESADSVCRQEAVLWLTLLQAGVIAAEAVPDLARQRQVLSEASHGVPRIIEVRHRHSIRPGDGFRMEPGLTNFRPIRKGQLLARDVRGDLTSPENGMVLLPLYQGLGDDGFFVAREVRMFWLRLSAILRRLRIADLLGVLPGVRRDGRRREVLVVDTRIARLFPLDFFHLFGFRKLRRTGNQLLVSRRVFDLEPPDRIGF